jgi:hypothetical protein
MRTVSDRSCRENQNTHFTFNTFFFFLESLLLRNNVEKYDRKQATDVNIIRHMRFAFWITKATDTHSQDVILIAFPRQQWLRESASMLRFTYIACLVFLRHSCVWAYYAPYTMDTVSSCHGSIAEDDK